MRRLLYLRTLTAAVAAAWVLGPVQPLVAQGNAECAADCSGSIGLAVGSDNFVFADWDGPEVPVWTYIPPAIDPATAPIAIILHGASRNPDAYRDAWADEAEKGGFIVIAPGFAEKDFPGLEGYAMGGVVTQAGMPQPKSRWTFSVIEPLFDDVVARLRGSQTSYNLYGHSAGSQFVHRYLYFVPEARVKRYLAANAGWYTRADMGVAFPFGLDGTPVTEERLRVALPKDVVILLGDQDKDEKHRLLNRSPEAMKQGRHRFARGQSFYAHARDLAREKSWEFGWTLRVVPGVAHSNSGMAQGSWDLID